MWCVGMPAKSASSQVAVVLSESTAYWSPLGKKRNTVPTTKANRKWVACRAMTGRSSMQHIMKGMKRKMQAVSPSSLCRLRTVRVRSKSWYKLEIHGDDDTLCCTSTETSTTANEARPKAHMGISGGAYTCTARNRRGPFRILFCIE